MLLLAPLKGGGAGGKKEVGICGQRLKDAKQQPLVSHVIEKLARAVGIEGFTSLTV